MTPIRDFSTRPDASTLWATRTESITVDPATLPPCVDAEDFEAWVVETLGVVWERPTHNSLDNALLHLTKEYLYRKQRVHHAHPDLHCIDTVYLRHAQSLFEKQMEMIRLNRFTLESPAPAKQTEEAEEKPYQELYIGETGEAE